VIIANLMKNIDNAKKVLRVAIPKAGRLSSFSAQGALKHAIMTDPKLIPEQTKSNLRPIIGKYIR